MKIQSNQLVSLLGAIALTAAVVLPVNTFATPGTIAGLAIAYRGSATGNNEMPWHIGKIRADDAWSMTSGGVNITVAILDTGIDTHHEDLAGKVIESVNFSRSRTGDDVNGHGTAMAGIIAGSLQNARGTVGVAYNVSLLDVKVAEDSGIVFPETVAKGIIWAVDHGASVINLSLVLSLPNEKVEEAINYAWGKGAVVVAAAGNTGTSRQTYPAAYPNVIAVGSTEKDDQPSAWSNKGDWVSVNAPGVEIYTTVLNGKYEITNGTSASTAQVSGEAALLFAIAVDTDGDGSTNDEIRAAIVNTTDSGRINTVKAAAALRNPATA